MKKILTTFLLLVLTVNLVGCGTDGTGQETAGTVEQLSEPVHYYVSKRQLEHPTGDVNLTEYTYDENWNIVSVRTLLNGAFASGTSYTFSADKTEVTIVTSSAHYESTETKLIRTLDSEGRVVRTTSFSGDSVASTSEYTYDAQGREIKTVSTQAGTGITTTVLRQYDGSGNLVEYAVEAGTYSTRQVHTYDAENRIQTSELYTGDELTGHIEYTWEGNTRRGSHYDPDGLLQQKSVAVVDAYGNVLVEESYDIRDSLLLRTSYIYIGSDGSISGGFDKG